MGSKKFFSTVGSYEKCDPLSLRSANENHFFPLNWIQIFGINSIKGLKLAHGMTGYRKRVINTVNIPALNNHSERLMHYHFQIWACHVKL